MKKKSPPQRELRLLPPDDLLRHLVTVVVHLADRYHSDPMVADALQALKDHFTITQPPPPIYVEGEGEQ